MDVQQWWLDLLSKVVQSVVTGMAVTGGAVFLARWVTDPFARRLEEHRARLAERSKVSERKLTVILDLLGEIEKEMTSGSDHLVGYSNSDDEEVAGIASRSLGEFKRTQLAHARPLLSPSLHAEIHALADLAITFFDWVGNQDWRRATAARNAYESSLRQIEFYLKLDTSPEVETPATDALRALHPPLADSIVAAEPPDPSG